MNLIGLLIGVLVLMACGAMAGAQQPHGYAPPARCPEYPGVLVMHQRTTISTGELNCVYTPAAKGKLT